VSYLRSWAPGPSDSTDAVVVLPPAGYGCLRLQAVAARLSDEVAVLGVQLPGREDRLRDQPAAGIAEVAADLAAELDTLPRQRLFLVGISLGALIAFETALLLPPGRAAAGLAVVAARAPEFWQDYPSENPPAAEIDGLLPASVRQSPLADYATAVLRADLRLTAGYQVRPACLPDTPLWAVSGSRDSVVTAEQMRGWSARSTAYRGHEVFEADHHEFVDDQVLARLIGCIADRSGSRA
jgi:surfactin synthase thioesterase subunit